MTTKADLEKYLHLPEDVEIIEIHTTDRGTFKKCRQLWDFSSNIRLNLEPKRPYEPFWFGTAIHEGLATYYDQIELGKASYEASLDASKVIINYIKDWYSDLEGPTTEDDERYDELMRIGPSMMAKYQEFAVKDDDFDVMWTEKTFHIPIPGLEEVEIDGRKFSVIYSFRTDGLVMDKNGDLWILEFKTAASLPEETDYLLMDDQVGSYLWALETVFGFDIKGVIYTWIRKEAPKPLKVLKNGELSVDKRQITDYSSALTQIREHYGDNIPEKTREFLTELQKQGSKFVKRERVKRNRKEIALLGEMLKHEVWDMVNNPAIYRTPTKFNCNRCTFLGPCLMKWEGSDPTEVLTSLYRPRVVVHAPAE